MFNFNLLTAQTCEAVIDQRQAKQLQVPVDVEQTECKTISGGPNTAWELTAVSKTPYTAHSSSVDKPCLSVCVYLLSLIHI